MANNYIICSRELKNEGKFVLKYSILIIFFYLFYYTTVNLDQIKRIKFIFPMIFVLKYFTQLIYLKSFLRWQFILKCSINLRPRYEQCLTSRYSRSSKKWHTNMYASQQHKVWCDKPQEQTLLSYQKITLTIDTFVALSFVILLVFEEESNYGFYFFVHWIIAIKRIVALINCHKLLRWY